MTKEECDLALDRLFYVGEKATYIQGRAEAKKLIQELIDEHFEAREKIMNTIINEVMNEWGYEGLDEDIKQIFDEFWK